MAAAIEAGAAMRSDPVVEEAAVEEALVLSPSLRVDEANAAAEQASDPEVALWLADVGEGAAQDLPAAGQDEGAGLPAEEEVASNLEYPAFGRRSLRAEGRLDDAAVAAIMDDSASGEPRMAEDAVPARNNVSTLPRAGFLFGSLREEADRSTEWPRQDPVDEDIVSAVENAPELPVQAPVYESPVSQSHVEAVADMPDSSGTGVIADAVENEADSGEAADAAEEPAASDLPVFEVEPEDMKIAEPSAPASVEAGEVTNLFTASGTEGEEALRDLITGILRQELQGVLGERITQNIRKLVREEIRQALDGRETG
ncbi:MAG: hypothetical protein ACK5JR_10705 [Tropicimonas sp.]|uniref:hypothetical protein n=1 Tax=Tropicimonas sp. TaxID=2067044 RepID=UPI003A88E5F1